MRAIAALMMFLLCFFRLFCDAAVAATLTSLVVRDEGAKTSIIGTFNGHFTQKTFLLHAPERVVVDLGNTSTAVNLSRLALSHGVVRHVRSGHPNRQTLRLVFDVTQPVTLHATTWRSANLKQQGLRMDLVPIHAASRASIPTPAPVTFRKEPTPQKSWPAHRGSYRGLRDVVVVLDPGHGGKDPGAIGSRRQAEKQVVLAIALKLKQLIDRQPGMHAVLTRQGDYYVGLRERMKIARRYNADLFIAIHADAFINRDSNGASVFALSQRGATSEAARWLAEKENYSELGGVNLSNLDDQNGVIRTVLLDLSQTATIGSSLQMGSRVLQSLGKITRLHNTKVEQARFMVLKSPDIPSILVETGFISNPREERNLTSPYYQMQLAQAIFSGIKYYFMDYPPHGTRVEMMSTVNPRLVRVEHSLNRTASRG